MRFYLLLLAIALPCAVLYVLYGRAYLWARRPVDDDLDDGAIVRRRLTRPERQALGMPMRCGALTVAVILSAFAAIALFRPLDPELAPFGLLAVVLLVACTVVFGVLDRLAAATTIRVVRGVLALPPQMQGYVPRGGLYVDDTPVLYPLHWLPAIESDIGQPVEIELTRHGAVVRHDNRLSLDTETQAFPYRPWEPTGVIAAALVVLTIASLFFYTPLGPRLSTAYQAVTAHRLVQIDSLDQWQAWSPRVGDEVTVAGLSGDCAWAAGGANSGGGAFQCSTIAIGAPEEVLAGIAPDPAVQAAEDLSRAMENMLLTRRNATPEEVRAHWRVAGQGGSQRWRLVSLARVSQTIDALCPGATCDARAVLNDAQQATAAKVAATEADTLTLDAAMMNRLAQAGFALAGQTLTPLTQAALAAAQSHRDGSAWIVHSVSGTPLAQVPAAATVVDGADRAARGVAGSLSPRLQLVQVRQALATSGQHVVQFSGAVRSVDTQARPAQLTVDTTVQPAASWIKVAPVATWVLLLVIALWAVVFAAAQRRVQRKRLAQIRKRFVDTADANTPVQPEA